MEAIRDPAWKINPDLTADETFDERYADDGYTIFDDDLAEEEIEEEQETALIAITQLPQIKENLHALRERWEQKAKEASELVLADGDSIQSIKAMRAEMRKEFDEADTQRKAVKERYMAAWTEVESTWKECVAEPFKAADNAYRVLINEFEQAAKDSCKAELSRYFSELCQVYGVDFMTLEQAMAMGGIKISMADAQAKQPKKLQEAVAAVLSRVADGMEQIAEMDDAAEVMAEYKQTFDVGSAVAAVQGRRRRIEAEKEAAEARRIEQERKRQVVEKVEAVAPPVQQTAPEKVYREFSFTVYNCTRTQLLKLRDYLKQEGIKYE